METWYRARVSQGDIKAVAIDWATSKKVRVHVGGSQFRIENRQSSHARFYPTFEEARTFLSACLRIKIGAVQETLGDLQNQLARLEIMSCPQLPS